MPKSDLNQAVVEQPKYIIINMSWDVHLLLPIKEGLEYLKIQSSGVKIEGNLRPDRDKPLKFTPNDQDVTIRYLSEGAFKRMKLEALTDEHLGEDK